MCEKDHFEEDLKKYLREGRVTRRDFGGLTAGVGFAMMLPRAANAQAVTETDVEIKTADGTCDAYFVHPSSGAHAAVLVWPDILGLRPAFRMMGKRLAESGYSVLVVNPFYRQKRAPVVPAGAAFDETTRGIVFPLAQALNATTHVNDAKAFIAWLDAQPFGRQESQDRHDRLLHGRADHDAHGRGGGGSRRSRGVVPRRRSRHAKPRQPALARAADESALPVRRRRERR